MHRNPSNYYFWPSCRDNLLQKWTARRVEKRRLKRAARHRTRCAAQVRRAVGLVFCDGQFIGTQTLRSLDFSYEPHRVAQILRLAIPKNRPGLTSAGDLVGYMTDLMIQRNAA